MGSLEGVLALRYRSSERQGPQLSEHEMELELQAAALCAAAQAMEDRAGFLVGWPMPVAVGVADNFSVGKQQTKRKYELVTKPDR